MTKRLSFFSVALMLFSLIASPVQPQVFSLWGDEGMTTCEVHLQTPYTPFTIFVFLDPGPDGAFAAEYKLTTPVGHFSPSSVINPVVSDATIGSWFNGNGISAPFTSCQAELFWVVNLTMMAPNTDPGYYAIEPNDDTGFLGVASCT